MTNVPPEQQQQPENQSTNADNASASPAYEDLANNTSRVLRIWPACLLIAILVATKSLLSFASGSMILMMTSFIGPLACSALILLWWLFFSRASLKEKTISLVGVLLIALVTTLLQHKSLQYIGTMLYAIPIGISGFAIALIFLASKPSAKRIPITLFVTLICFGYWDLIRIDDYWGDFHYSQNWRWQSSEEQQFLQAQKASTTQHSVATISDQALNNPAWSEFRGPRRDGIQPGIALDANWDSQSVRQLWRIKVGPSWSSFSVAGDYLFTQEQRGEIEVVVCYSAQDGSEVWVHESDTRFWEAMGGAGPRATPTLADGNLYTLGATGLLHRLDPKTGEQLWQRDLNADAKRKPPQWGYASSPLVTDGLVIVHAGGKDDKGIFAYDINTGDIRWSAPTPGTETYSSPHLATLAGQSCLIMINNQGLTILNPTDGSVLGNYENEFQGYRVVQPWIVGDSSILLGTPRGAGTQRLELKWQADTFSIEESWLARGLSPHFNDAVIHDGYLYGFDSSIFACIDLATGERQWKKGRYGNGQVLLLSDAGQLLVISEKGELVLLKTNPEKLTELARHQVLEGRTWNHPVLIDNHLYIRNAQEAACYELPLATETSISLLQK